MKKSYIFQFLLTLLLGPVGLFYSSTPAALGFILASLVLVPVSLGLAVVLIWPICILVGFSMVARHNHKLSVENRRHEELLKAVRASAQKS